MLKLVTTLFPTPSTCTHRPSLQKAEPKLLSETLIKLNIT